MAWMLPKPLTSIKGLWPNYDEIQDGLRHGLPAEQLEVN